MKSVKKTPILSTETEKEQATKTNNELPDKEQYTMLQACAIGKIIGISEEGVSIQFGKRKVLFELEYFGETIEQMQELIGADIIADWQEVRSTDSTAKAQRPKPSRRLLWSRKFRGITMEEYSYNRRLFFFPKG